LFARLPRASRSIPFPYTTLFRADSLGEPGRGAHRPVTADHARVVRVGVEHLGGIGTDGVSLQDELLEADSEDVAEVEDEKQHDRSEEHTSELQSRFDLVCRLLLE